MITLETQAILAFLQVMMNGMICSDIWYKYHECDISKLLYVIHELLGDWNLRQFWNITSAIYAKYQLQIMLLFVYTTTEM